MSNDKSNTDKINFEITLIVSTRMWIKPSNEWEFNLVVKMFKDESSRVNKQTVIEVA